MVKNPNWQEADQLAFFQSVTRDYRETNPASDRVRGLEPVTSGLQHQRPKPLDHAASSYNDHNFFNKVEHSCKSTLRTQKNAVELEMKSVPLNNAPNGQIYFVANSVKWAMKANIKR